METFKVEVPTVEIILHTDLIKEINQLSLSFTQTRATTEWTFSDLTLTLKCVFLIHAASAPELMSHRVKCDDYYMMDYIKGISNKPEAYKVPAAKPSLLAILLTSVRRKLKAKRITGSL